MVPDFDTTSLLCCARPQSSGIVLNEEVRWITFHSGCAAFSSPLRPAVLCHVTSRGLLLTLPRRTRAYPPTRPPRYDFGYLLKLLTCAPLPNSEDEFSELLRIYFPIAYDMKCGRA